MLKLVLCSDKSEQAPEFVIKLFMPMKLEKIYLKGYFKKVWDYLVCWKV